MHGMEIRQPAPHVLELADTGALFIRIGAFVAGLGGAAALLALLLHHPIAAVLVAGLLGGVGAMCATRAHRITHVLDARRGTLTITSTPRFGRERPITVEQHRLGELTAIELEAKESSDAEGTTSTVYRACYVFRNGTRRPWSSIWTSNRASHEEPRQAAMGFLTQAGYLALRA